MKPVINRIFHAPLPTEQSSISGIIMYNMEHNSHSHCESHNLKSDFCVWHNQYKCHPFYVSSHLRVKTDYFAGKISKKNETRHKRSCFVFLYRMLFLYSIVTFFCHKFYLPLKKTTASLKYFLQAVS